MSRSGLLFGIMCVCAMASTVWATEPAGLLAEWNFDEGQGEVVSDSNSRGLNGKISGAQWTKHGDGFAISLDGFGRELPKRLGGFDVHAPAGSVVIFNNCSYHCATIRHTQRQRRTVHVRYRQPEPTASRHALKPPWNSVAEFWAAMPKRLG